ncbi:MAG: ATP-binding protein, partial [Bacteroidetes bacterium]|nr:ATP-binding protein [Bacteroidota bacterium]
MDPKLKTDFTDRLVKSIATLSSQQFPHVAKIVIEHNYGIHLELRGQTISGEPVGHTLDANSDGFEDVAEFGKGADYFTKPFRKIWNDYQHCLDVAPQCKRMFLMSSRECGPKNYKRLNRVAAWLGKRINKEIFVFDGRWLTTYIIDKILEPQDTVTLELLEQHLAFFTQIRIEFGYSHDLPRLPKDNWPRPLSVKDALNILDQHSYIQIHGLSGMGKTYLAVQLFYALKKADVERMVIWIPGNTITNAESLSYLKIERYSVPQNILGLIKRFNCVVIIDSLENGVEDVVKRVEQENSANCKLIITSQTKADLISTYDIPPSDDELSDKILNAGLQKPCPSQVYQQIIDSIGGHPFLLDQINILIKKEHVSWTKVIREKDTLTASTFDNQAFYDRLFVHHLKTAAYELGVLKWINTKEIDESLLLSLIGRTGIKKLKARNFFNAYRNGAFVLHDIVLNSLRSTIIQFDENAIEDKLADRLKTLYHEFDPAYYRIIHAHKILILRLLIKLANHDVYKYSYLISVPLADYDERFVPETSDSQLEMAFRNFNSDDYFLIMSWIEQTEKVYRIIKSTNRENTTAFLTPRINKI